MSALFLFEYKFFLKIVIDEEHGRINEHLRKKAAEPQMFKAIYAQRGNKHYTGGKQDVFKYAACGAFFEYDKPIQQIIARCACNSRRDKTGGICKLRKNKAESHIDAVVNERRNQ